MNKKEHRAALRKIGRWMDLDLEIESIQEKVRKNHRILTVLETEKKNFQDEDILKLVDEVEKYEKKNFPIDMPSIGGAIEFRLDQMGLKTSFLSILIGSRSHASELLSGKRKPSKRIIKLIHEHLGVPLDVLLQ